MCGKVSLGIWASHAKHRGGEQGRVLQKEGGSRSSTGWPQKAAAKEVISEVKRGQAEKPGEDGRTFPAVRSKAWSVAEMLPTGREREEHSSPWCPRAGPKGHTQEGGAEGEETEPVTA